MLGTVLTLGPEGSEDLHELEYLEKPSIMARNDKKIIFSLNILTPCVLIDTEHKCVKHHFSKNGFLDTSFMYKEEFNNYVDQILPNFDKWIIVHHEGSTV